MTEKKRCSVYSPLFPEVRCKRTQHDDGVHYGRDNISWASPGLIRPAAKCA